MSQVTKNIGMVLALAIAGLNACTADDGGRSERVKPKTQETAKTATDTNQDTDPATTFASEEDESVEIPSRIAGALLTCALRKEASDTDLSQEYGCFLSDAVSGKKLDQDPLINWQSSEASGLVFSEPNSAYTSALYNTLLAVTGDSKGEIDRKVLSTDIIALYGFKSVVVKRLFSVLKPAYEIEDFEAPVVRDQSIAPDRDGSPVDPF